MTTLTFKLDPKTVHYLVRNEELSGGPPKRADTTFFIQALPTPPSRPRVDGSKPEYSVGLMDIMGTDKKGARDILTRGADVFIKWASDNARIAKLLHEARLYTKELAGLQGTVVPRLVGTFSDRKENPKFVCLILEHLSGTIPDDLLETKYVSLFASQSLESS